MEEELECTCNFNCGKHQLLGTAVAILGFGIVVAGHVFMCKK